VRILIAIGGSTGLATDGLLHSRATLQFGAWIAQDKDEPPNLITVIRGEAERHQADAILTGAAQMLQATLPSIPTKIRIGHPAEEIIREAEEGRYELVIVGERQDHSLVTRFLLGSTTVRVVEHAPCPVIIAKGRVGPVRRILVCDSGIEAPSLLNRFVAQLAELIKGKEEVTVLHVMSQISAGPGIRGQQLRADAQELIENQAPEGELLEQDIKLLKRLKLHPRAKVRHGFIVDEILAEARDGDYDLVVIGAHRGEGWRRILLDDLAHQIIVQMDRPVLVVR
jgi:nucleotide-binding universal stress UspA family protein